MSYENWKNEEFKSNEECYLCMEVQKAKEDASEFFIALLDQFYGESFSKEKCEWYLEELGGYLGVKIPKNDLNIEGKRI